MKKFLESLRWDDRTKLIAAAAATGAVLLFAMLFPLTFRRSAEPAVADAGARAALFSAYWDAGAQEETVSVRKLETPDEEMAARCTAHMRTLIRECIDDRRLPDLEPSGYEYSLLRAGRRQMTVCRMWLDQTGDWHNLLDVCFDAESGMLCYLYLSRECLSNRSDYPASDTLTCSAVVERLAAALGGTVRHTDSRDDTACTALIDTPTGTVAYRVECSVFDRLVDLRLSCF